MLRVSVAVISLDAGHIGVQHLDVLDVVFGNVEDVAVDDHHVGELIITTGVTSSEDKDWLKKFIIELISHKTSGLTDFIAQNINLRHNARQRVLEELHPDKRLRIVNDILTHEVDVISLVSVWSVLEAQS